MKRAAYFLIHSLTLLVSCTNSNEIQDEKIVEKELVPVLDSTVTNPLKDGKLRLLITNHFNTYYIEHGNEMGLEFDLIKLYAKERGLEVELEVVHGQEDIHDSIIIKKSHFAASTFATPLDTLGEEKMSDYLYKTDIVLVRREESPSLDEAKSLIEAHVIIDGPFVKSVLRQNKYDHRIKGIPAHENDSKQSLIEDVANGVIDYTVCSRNEAEIMQVFYKNLNIDEVLYKDQPISLLVHPECTELLKDFNDWLGERRAQSDFQWTIHKYHNVPSDLRREMEHVPPKIVGSKISDFDKLVQSHSRQIEWDWKLLSALIYQESRFNSQCKSYVGALGLMQVMPRTASAYAVSANELFIPDRNLYAGTKFIDWMQSNFYSDPNISPEDRQKFIIASYNAGPGHVQDAMRLAEKNNLNPYVWDDNVEKMVLAKSKAFYYRDPVVKHGYCRGIETVTYVRNVMRYYQHYNAYVPNR